MEKNIELQNLAKLNVPQENSFIKHRNEAIKATFKDRLYNSLAQAIIKVFLTPYVVVKIFLILFVLGSSGLASYLVIQSIMTYFTYGVSTTSRIINETPTLFPKITFCNVNKFQTQFAFNLTHNLDFDGENLSNDVKKKLGHNLNDILLECTFNQNKCSQTDFTWSFDPLYGNCYTFNSGFDSNGNKIDLNESLLSDPYYGLELTLYVNVYEKLLDTITYAAGVVVRIGNSSYLTDFGTAGVFITSGFNTFISVNREFKSILPKPYSNCDIDLNSASNEQNSDLYNLIVQSNYAYSQQLCFKQCGQMTVISKYNCSLPYILSLYNNVKTCNMGSISKIDLIYSADFINEICLPLCPLECSQNVYTSSVSFYQLNGKKYVSSIQSNSNLASDFINRSIDSMTIKESIVHVNIFYDSLYYTLSTESPQMDLVSLLASIGGNLSLFLGVSVFSLCELIEVGIEMIFIYRSSKRIKSNSNNY